MKTRFFLVFLCLLFPMNSQGVLSWQSQNTGSFAAKAVISSESLSLPEILMIRLSLKYPDNYHVDPQALEAQLLDYNVLNAPGFMLESKTMVNRQTDGDGTIAEEWEFRLHPQVAGTYPLSFFTISFLPNNSELDQPIQIISGLFVVDIAPLNISEKTWPLPASLMTLSQDLPLNVSIVQDTRVEEQRRILAERLLEKEVPWILVGVALLGGIWIFLSLQTKTESSKRKSYIRIRREAQEELQSLQKAVEQNPKDLRKKFVQLNHLARYYLEGEFDVQTSTVTTSEVVQKLRRMKNLGQQRQANLEKFFVQADRIKFGGQEPTRTDWETAIHEVQALMSLKADS